MKTKTLQLTNSVNRSHVRLAFLLMALASFALSPQARATCQQGCLTNQNTVLGDDALISNSTGSDNTALGFTALSLNTTGIHNTATGFAALQVNTTGNFNTAIGQQSLKDNTTGSNNTATGDLALGFNTTGEANTATGASALARNDSGNANTANGTAALFTNTTGSYNTAVGDDALDDNATGSYNTAVGKDALGANRKGNQNTAIGSLALDHCKGENSSGNIALGNGAGTTLTLGKDNIYVGNPGQMTEANTIRIGTTGIHTATFIAGISGAAVVGDTVVVDGNGQLGTVASAARFKKEIRPMDKTSEAILALKPVTFQYQNDSKGTPQFGLIADEVAMVNSDLVVRDRKGEVYSVRYEAVNAMLLNEFLKEHVKTGQLKKDFESKIAGQQKEIDALKAELKEQKALIQNVSAQIELSKPAPQIVVNNQ